MLKLPSFAILFLTGFVALSGYADELETFTIAGEIILVGTDREIVGEEYRAIEKNVDHSIEPFVEVIRKDVDEDGKSVDVEFASGHFKDGKVVLKGSINERTVLLLFIYGANEVPIRWYVVGVPGERSSFVLLDYVSSREKDRLLVDGESRFHLNSESKFTVWGDLSSITDIDLSTAVAEITPMSTGFYSGTIPFMVPVLLREGSFLIEGIVYEPQLIQVNIFTIDAKFIGRADVVVERGARIKISPAWSSMLFVNEHTIRFSNLIATSESEQSMHAKVIDSWQSSPEYLAQLNEYASAMKSQQEMGRTELERTHHEDLAIIEDAAAHVSRSPFAIYKELEEIKSSRLSGLVRNVDNPMAALLALELGAPESYRIERWLEIADSFDKSMVNRRVLPRPNFREKQIKFANVQRVVKGELATEFTLANIKGELNTLTDVLSKNEVVLVSFWASWCVPCIAAIPKLKELYSNYKKEGFEIVFVSIDESYDAWERESMQHGLTWTNVGDLNGWHAATAVNYGVYWLPTEFAINSNGEILDRGLTAEELEELLANHFGHKLGRERSDLSVPTAASTE